MLELKLKYMGFLLTLLFLFPSCKKNYSSVENLDLADYKLSSLQGSNNFSNGIGTVTEEFGILHFSNKEMFDSVMQTLYNLDENQTKNWFSRFAGFISLNDYMESLDLNETDKTCSDTKLASVLNKESMIWIDSNLFLIDWEKDSIYETYPVNRNTINKIKTKIEIKDSLNFYVFRYSSYDEVLYPMTVTGNTVSSRAFRWTKKIFGRCKDASAERRIDKSEIEYTNSSNTSSSKYKVKLVYQPAGLWFSLLIKVKHYTKNENGKYRLSVGAVCSADDYAYRKMCGGSDQNITFCYNNSPRASVDPKWVRKFYAGMTKLNKYKVICDLFLEDTYTAGDLFSRKEISHNF